MGLSNLVTGFGGFRPRTNPGLGELRFVIHLGDGEHGDGLWREPRVLKREEAASRLSIHSSR